MPTLIEITEAAKEHLIDIQRQLAAKREQRDDINAAIRALVVEEEDAERILGALTRPKRTRKPSTNGSSE